MAHQWGYGQYINDLSMQPSVLRHLLLTEGHPMGVYSQQGIPGQQYQTLAGQMGQAPQQYQMVYATPQGQLQYAQMPYSQAGMIPAGYPGQPTQSMYGSSTGVDPQVYNWFMSVDTDQSGKITAKELQQALFNADWKHFNNETIRLMISMFDKDQSGTIDLQEFQQLWKFIQEWRAIFDQYDRGSGKIGPNEIQSAYQQMGFNLSPSLVNIITTKFDSNGQRCLTIGSFVQSCVLLRLLTSAFKQRDPMLAGRVTMQYEDFMTLAVHHMV